MPQCPDSPDAVSWVQTPGTVWLQPIGTQRENLYWLRLQDLQVDQGEGLVGGS